jgi:hypothetical protein
MDTLINSMDSIELNGGKIAEDFVEVIENPMRRHIYQVTMMNGELYEVDNPVEFKQGCFVFEQTMEDKIIVNMGNSEDWVRMVDRIREMYKKHEWSEIYRIEIQMRIAEGIKVYFYIDYRGDNVKLGEEKIEKTMMMIENRMIEMMNDGESYMLYFLTN